MALRFFLVTFVATLGMELPSSEQISSWTRSGRTWIAARIDDWSVTTAKRAQEAKDRAFRGIVDDMSRQFARDLAHMNAEKAAAEAKRVAQIKDKAFRSIVDDMSRRFTEDVAQMEAKKVEERKLAQLQPISIPDQFELDVVGRLILEATSPDERIEVADLLQPSPVDTIIQETEKVVATEKPAEQVAQTEKSAAPAVEAEKLKPSLVAVAAEVNVVVEHTDTTPSQSARLSSAIRLTREAMGAWAALLQGSGAIVRR